MFFLSVASKGLKGIVGSNPDWVGRAAGKSKRGKHLSMPTVHVRGSGAINTGEGKHGSKT